MSTIAQKSAAGIPNLPCELVATILRQLDSIQDLLASRLACHHLDDSFLQDKSLAIEVLLKEIRPAVVSIAVAAFRCSHQTSTLESCKSILNDFYNDPSCTNDSLRDVDFAGLMQIWKKHNTIRSLVQRFAQTSWTKTGKQRPVRLSHAEQDRFDSAFHRFDLICAYMRAQSRSGVGAQAVSEAKRDLLSRFPPWANEQVGCVYDFLEVTLSEATRETVAHDVQLGERRIDYLKYGNDNMWLQSRLSRGIEYIHAVLDEESMAEQAALLQAERDNPHNVTVFDVLCSHSGADMEEDDVLLQEYSMERLESLTPQANLVDPDPGPFEAWFAAHEESFRAGWVLFGGHDGLRERAYVLWDSDRLHREGLLEAFQNIGEFSTRQHTDEEQDAMVYSWEERSSIWRKGGSGFWYEGDESTISWRR